MRRLLSLDYVIEHPDLPWLPTEREKVATFEALGIGRRLLPSRLYRGVGGDTRRYFPSEPKDNSAGNELAAGWPPWCLRNHAAAFRIRRYDPPIPNERIRK